jgi:hypothetical protein
VRFGAWAIIFIVVVLLGPISQCCSNFDERTSISTLVSFYLIVSLFLIGFLLRALILWRRVPSSAIEGLIEIGDTSILYQVGLHHREVLLSEIARAEPLIFSQGKYPAALWLSFKDDGPGPNS